MDNTDLSKDLRVRNVSLHSRGKTEEGTLYLTRHHLIFSYFPNAPAAGATERISTTSARAVSGRPESVRNSLSGNDPNTADTPRKDSTNATRAHTASSDSGNGQSSIDLTPKQPASKQKARPKEVWLPYPMINHCMLRPSNSQGRAADYSHEDMSDEEAEDSAFPPVYGTNTYSTRPSTDSTNLMPSFSPQRSISPGPGTVNLALANDTGKPPALRLRRRDFQMMAFHFHSTSSEKSPDDTARDVFYRLRSRCCVNTVQDLHAFHFKAPQEEVSTGGLPYDARKEFARMGIAGKKAEGPGNAWRISDINRDYTFSATYPSVLCVPSPVSDNMLKYGGPFRSKCRVPALTYLHHNGGSITRSSQPMVGATGKRNPQDERLVHEIFCSHTPPSKELEGSISKSSSMVHVPVPHEDGSADIVLPTSLSDTAVDEKGVGSSETPYIALEKPEYPEDTPETKSEKAAESNDKPKKVYGTTRRNLIVDARPRINALANRATGGGIEDVSNYVGNTDVVVERVFLNIANIHVMRGSLDKIIEAFGNSDYLDMKPNQKDLRNSGWLGHISGLLEGAEMVARVVGLGGSHVLLHCSDGWDRTSQVAALAEIMLDPHYRTLQGFITLIQKDFLSFGHKFNHRHGIQGSEKWFEIENERVLPSRGREGNGSESSSFNALGAKAFTGAKNWFDKNKSSIFRGSNEPANTDGTSSRPPSPPANSLLHSPPTASPKPDPLHKVDTREIAPIFHQFLDAVFQLQHRNPDSFEFNERFLIRLFYQAHSGQYGEFLFNTEKERSENADKTNSVWSHFLSRRREFVNPEYIGKVDDPLLFAPRQSAGREVEVVWWSGLFGRKDEDMVVPVLEPTMSKGSIFDSVPQFGTHLRESDGSGIKKPSIFDAVPQFSTAKEREMSTHVEGNIESLEERTSAEAASGGVESGYKIVPLPPRAPRPVLEQRETDEAVLAKYVVASQEGQEVEPVVAAQVDPEVEAELAEAVKNVVAEEEGDPLGVSPGRKVAEMSMGRMDAAAFARESAYSDR